MERLCYESFVRDRQRRKVFMVDHVSKILGGAEVNLVELLQAPGVMDRWEVTVACAPKGPLSTALNHVDCRQVAYGYGAALNELRVVGRSFSLWNHWRGWLELERAKVRLREHLIATRPDVVISCTNKDHFAAGKEAAKQGLPSVWWVNDLLTSDFFSWPIRRMFAFQARNVGAWLAPVSEAGGRALQNLGITRDKIRVIPNGIDLTRYNSGRDRPLRRELGIGSLDPLVGVVGRLTPWKGQSLFLEIAARWIELGHSGHFVLIGSAFNEDSSYDRQLREWVSKRELDKRIHFVPFQPDIVGALSSLDLLLHTSTRPEPFGRVLIEAMAVGVPVIGANAGGVREILEDGLTGAVVEPGDVNGYLDWMQRWRKDSELAGRWRTEGRRRVEQHFSIERVLDSMDEWVRRSIGR